MFLSGTHMCLSDEQCTSRHALGGSRTMGNEGSTFKCSLLQHAPWETHGDEMLNDCELQRHQNWIFALSASFDSLFDPCWQHAGHV